MTGERTWVYDNDPSTAGWYAGLFCWDAMEGVHIGACFWSGTAWVEGLPMVGWAGPFADSNTAYKYAVDNDPDGVA